MYQISQDTRVRVHLNLIQQCVVHHAMEYWQGEVLVHFSEALPSQMCY